MNSLAQGSRWLRITLGTWLRATLLAAAWLGATTLLLILLNPMLGPGDTALLYLPAVAMAASAGGVEAGVVAAIMALALGNYLFVPPYHTLSLLESDPPHLTSLVVFVLIGLFMGLQAGYAREREAEARSRDREVHLLDRLTAHLTSQTEATALVTTLLEEITEATGTRRAVLLVPSGTDVLLDVAMAGPERGPLPPAQREAARWAYEKSRVVGLRQETLDHATGLDECRPLGGDLGVHLPLVTSNRTLGVLYVDERRDGRPYGPRDERLLRSISHLVAVHLERQRLETYVIEAQTLREADHLKVTLMSSVSHELKTPLASVTARITNLLEDDTVWHADLVRRELGSVNEDLVRLNDSISDLLDLSRLQTGGWRPRLDWYELGEIVGTVMTRFPTRQRDRVHFQIPEDLPSLCIDYSQMARALQHLLENGLEYSPATEPVTLGAKATGSEYRIWVEDHGAGVAPEERQRIFQQFYRGRAASLSPAGTGLGLAIAQEIVAFHHGTISVEDVHPRGARFVVTLPCPSGDLKEGIG